MGTKDDGPLVEMYQSRIGVPSTRDEAYGYWVFVLGVVLGFLGIALVLVSESPGEPIRGYGIALAAVGLVLLLIGPIIRLPLKRGATVLSYLGAVIGLAAVAWFLLAFLDGNWGAAFANNEVSIIGLYGLGVFAVSLGSLFVPLLTSPREEQLAAEARAADAESERDAAIAEAERQAEEAEKRAREAEKQAEEARRQSDAAATERSEREQLAAELAEIRASQSQFELYTDRGGNHRWRLRHRNRNIVADSSQGYASRRSAQQGLNAVRRDAVGAALVDLDEQGVDIEEPDDAVESEDAPAFVEEVASRATFETYEDAGGDHRWRLRHDNGEILADSAQGYSDKRGRDAAVDRVRGYVRPAEYLRIDPAAFELYRDRGGKFRWRLLHRNGNVLADSGQGYASRQKARQGVDSVAGNVGEDGNAEFEVYEDAAGEFRWRLRHDNGNIIADGGEGYATESGAEEAVARVREYAPEADALDIGSAAFEIYEDAAGEFRWRLRHRNGRIMADSGEGYAGRSGVEKGIDSVKRNAPNAEQSAVEE